ncbi:MAG: antitoxin Xre/MbcA/ParS toxin-binding domain-containing protein [Candidatus Sulfotelmatobacter sp.]
METSFMVTMQQAVVGFSWDVAVDLSTKENRTRLSPAAIKGLLRIAKHWKLRDQDTRVLLGGISSGSFYALKNQATKTLDGDQLTRISLLVGIYKALNILYGQKLADAWIALPNTNPMFGGASPLNYLSQGGIPAFLRVRQLLDARRGGR